MPIKQFKPTTPGRRNASGHTFEELTKKRPERSLVESLKKRHAGRNNQGRLTVRHRGGGNKRLYRRIDWKREKHGVPARVASIEYDPNRSARIALLHYADGEKRYILAPNQLAVDDMLMSGPDAELRVGNAMPLLNMPTGTQIHNVELTPGRGGQLVRTAGAAAQLMAKEGEYALLRLPSSEMRRVRIECMATIGQVGNIEHGLIKLGKAGRSRHRRRRPQVRGSVMNPVDHPHGGGEGKTSGGRDPVSPWGQSAKGLKTRKNKRTNKFIISRKKKRK